MSERVLANAGALEAGADEGRAPGGLVIGDGAVADFGGSNRTMRGLAPAPLTSDWPSSAQATAIQGGCCMEVVLAWRVGAVWRYSAQTYDHLNARKTGPRDPRDEPEGMQDRGWHRELGDVCAHNAQTTAVRGVPRP